MTFELNDSREGLPLAPIYGEEVPVIQCELQRGHSIQSYMQTQG